VTAGTSLPHTRFIEMSSIVIGISSQKRMLRYRWCLSRPMVGSFHLEYLAKDDSE